jgi:hypothetical protein
MDAAALSHLGTRKKAGDARPDWEQIQMVELTDIDVGVNDSDDEDLPLFLIMKCSVSIISSSRFWPVSTARR